MTTCLCLLSAGLMAAWLAGPVAAAGAAAPAAAVAASAPMAEDRAEVDRTPIVGNRELPKVLHIVPWKAAPAVSAALAASAPAAPALRPVDRDVLRRQLRWRAATAPVPQPLTSSPPGGGPSP